MPGELYAACRKENEELTVKAVPILPDPLRDQVVRAVADQAEKFLDVEDEIRFDAKYKPDRDELVCMDITPEAQLLMDTVTGSNTGVGEVDVSRFAQSSIKALFVGDRLGRSNPRVCGQRFTARQMLDRKFSFLGEGPAFRRLKQSVFTLPTSLAFVIERGVIKYKSPFTLQQIFDVSDLYREATDKELQSFAEHDNIYIADADAFLDTANRTTRTLVGRILDSGILDRLDATQIKEAASNTALELRVRRDRVVIPSDRRMLRTVLQFLDKNRYRDPLTAEVRITNSSRRAA